MWLNKVFRWPQWCLINIFWSVRLRLELRGILAVEIFSHDWKQATFKQKSESCRQDHFLELVSKNKCSKRKSFVQYGTREIAQHARVCTPATKKRGRLFRNTLKFQAFQNHLLLLFAVPALYISWQIHQLWLKKLPETITNLVACSRIFTTTRRALNPQSKDVEPQGVISRLSIDIALARMFVQIWSFSNLSPLNVLGSLSQEKYRHDEMPCW